MTPTPTPTPIHCRKLKRDFFRKRYLESHCDLAFSPDGRIFVCQQTGQLRVIENGVLVSIRRFDPATGTSQPFATGLNSPVDLKIGPDGNLYYLVRGGGGAVFRVIHSP